MHHAVADASGLCSGLQRLKFVIERNYCGDPKDIRISALGTHRAAMVHGKSHRHIMHSRAECDTFKELLYGGSMDEPPPTVNRTLHWDDADSQSMNGGAPLRRIPALG